MKRKVATIIENPTTIRSAVKRLVNGELAWKIADDVGIARSTLYNWWVAAGSPKRKKITREARYNMVSVVSEVNKLLVARVSALEKENKKLKDSINRVKKIITEDKWDF